MVQQMQVAGSDDTPSMDTDCVQVERYDFIQSSAFPLTPMKDPGESEPQCCHSVCFTCVRSGRLHYRLLTISRLLTCALWSRLNTANLPRC